MNSICTYRLYKCKAYRKHLGAAPLVFKGAGFDFPGSESPSMLNQLNRYYGQGDLHFITFSCYAAVPI